jgi:hypothetical protein
MHTESLQLFRELGNRWCATSLLNSLGKDLHALKDYTGAFSSLAESLTLSQELDNKRMIAIGLEGMAHLALTLAQPERAAILYAAAEQLRLAIHSPLTPKEQAEYDDLQQELNALAGASALSIARTKGAAMTLEQSIAYALLPD